MTISIHTLQVHRGQRQCQAKLSFVYHTTVSDELRGSLNLSQVRRPYVQAIDPYAPAGLLNNSRHIWNTSCISLVISSILTFFEFVVACHGNGGGVSGNVCSY